MLTRIFVTGRMLIESMENRVIVGTAAFMGIIIVLGWIAINEQGRMSAFERQFNARSTERGAALFVSSCATCHGADGRGSGLAPALNNPQLFGHDFFPEITAEIATLTEERENRENPPDDERIAEIDALIEELNAQRAADIGAAIRAGYDPQEPERLRQVAWQGGLENFLTSTITSGRPVSSSYWPNPMPAWGQSAGGPLRTDEIEDLVRYVMNWERPWTLDDLNGVAQFAIEPCNAANPATCEGLEAVTEDGGGALTADSTAGTDVDALLAALETVQGNPQEGQTIYNGLGGCAACHVSGAGSIAPALDGTFTRVQETRLGDAALEGYSETQYLAESIVNPAAYAAPGYNPIMPSDFGNRLTVQQVAHLVAFLESQDGESPE